jgi:hypothetical protein
MSGIPFHDTRGGRIFFDVTLADLVKHLTRLQMPWSGRWPRRAA